MGGASSLPEQGHGLFFDVFDEYDFSCFLYDDYDAGDDGDDVGGDVLCENDSLLSFAELHHRI